MVRMTRARRITAAALLVGAALALPGISGSGESPASAAVARGAAGDGQRTLTVSPSEGLDPNGQTVSASGSGYDEARGIYVAFCVVPAPGQVPSPCGGGAGGGGSAWISSNPPAYGVGVAAPYGPGGSFSVVVTVTPTIGGVDCRQVQCAVVTRNDHTLPGDRSQDVVVPVSFAAAPSGGGGGGVAAGGDNSGGGGFAVDGSVAPATDAPPVDLAALAAALAQQALPAPVLTPAADGLSTSDGQRTLRVQRARGLTDGTSVRVAGIGYDATKSIDVALCAAPVDGKAPGPCRTEGAAWVAAAGTDGRAPTAAYGADGSFAVEVDVSPVIAEGVDCRRASCVLATRNDSSRPNDRSQDLTIPVTFAARAAVDANTRDRAQGSPAATVEAGTGSTDRTGWIVVTGAVLVAGAGIVTLLIRRRGREAQS